MKKSKCRTKILVEEVEWVPYTNRRGFQHHKPETVKRVQKQPPSASPSKHSHHASPIPSPTFLDQPMHDDVAEEHISGRKTKVRSNLSLSGPYDGMLL